MSSTKPQLKWCWLIHEVTGTHEICDSILMIKGQLSTSFYACWTSWTRTFNYSGVWIVQLGFRKWQLHHISFHLSESFFLLFISKMSRSNTNCYKTSSFYALFHLVLNLFTICWVRPMTALSFFLWLVWCSHGCFWSFSSVINYHCDQIQSILFAPHTVPLDCASGVLNCHHNWCSWLSGFFLSLYSCKSFVSLFLSQNSSKIPAVVF